MNLRGFPLLAFSGFLWTAGCEVNSELPCSSESECVRAGQENGKCIREGGQSFCAFPDTNCEGGGYVWDQSAAIGKAGTCVSVQTLSNQTDTIFPPRTAGAACPKNPLQVEPGYPCGFCKTGRYECINNEMQCIETLFETPVPRDQVSVQTNGCFNLETCNADNAIDGLVSTSWFSRGSLLDNRPPFTWTIEEPACLTQITITGNAKNEDQKYREGYGFARIFVRVLDENGGEVFKQPMEYPRGPQPVDLILLAPDKTHGVFGKTVELLFVQHEDDTCGGFSELVVQAAKPPVR
jgi:hypothetical protein